MEITKTYHRLSIHVGLKFRNGRVVQGPSASPGFSLLWLRAGLGRAVASPKPQREMQPLGDKAGPHIHNNVPWPAREAQERYGWVWSVNKIIVHPADYIRLHVIWGLTQKRCKFWEFGKFFCQPTSYDIKYIRLEEMKVIRWVSTMIGWENWFGEEKMKSRFSIRFQKSTRKHQKFEINLPNFHNMILWW